MKKKDWRKPNKKNLKKYKKSVDKQKKLAYNKNRSAQRGT